MNTYSKKNRFGFSIIEVLASITLLVIGLFSIVKLFPYGMKISRFAEKKSLAAVIAQEKMETLISSGYEGIDTGTIEARSQVSTGNFGYKYHFDRETTVIYVDGDLNESESDTGMKQIEVTVFWNAKEDVEETVIFNRLMSRR